MRPEIGEQSLLQQERCRFPAGQRETEKLRLVDQTFGQSQLKAHFIRHEAARIISATCTLHEPNPGFHLRDNVPPFQERERMSLQFADCRGRRRNWRADTGGGGR